MITKLVIITLKWLVGKIKRIISNTFWKITFILPQFLNKPFDNRPYISENFLILVLLLSLTVDSIVQ